MPVDSLTAEVLQRGDAGGERAAEHQRDLLSTRVNVVGAFGVQGPSGLLGPGAGGGRHVVVHQLQHAVEAGHGLAAARVALQREAAALALDAQVLGARLRLDAEGEEVPLVRAVPDEEGAGGLGAQQHVGLAARHRAPVEAALLQLAHGVHHQLVLALRAERLEAQAGVQGAAHPGGGELAVGDHGARSQLCALGVLLPGAAAATPSPAAQTAVRLGSPEPTPPGAPPARPSRLHPGMPPPPSPLPGTRYRHPSREHPKSRLLPSTGGPSPPPPSRPVPVPGAQCWSRWRPGRGAQCAAADGGGAAGAARGGLL